MPKSYIGGFEKIVKKNIRRWDEEDESRRNDKYKNKRDRKNEKKSSYEDSDKKDFYVDE